MGECMGDEEGVTSYGTVCLCGFVVSTSSFLLTSICWPSLSLSHKQEELKDKEEIKLRQAAHELRSKVYIYIYIYKESSSSVFLHTRICIYIASDGIQF